MSAEDSAQFAAFQKAQRDQRQPWRGRRDDRGRDSRGRKLRSTPVTDVNVDFSDPVQCTNIKALLNPRGTGMAPSCYCCGKEGQLIHDCAEAAAKAEANHKKGKDFREANKEFVRKYKRQHAERMHASGHGMSAPCRNCGDGHCVDGRCTAEQQSNAVTTTPRDADGHVSWADQVAGDGRRG